MPSIVGHVTVPLALHLARAMPRRLLMLGLVGCMLPDADTLATFLGVRGTGALAHRGFTHSIAFAACIGLIASRLPWDGMPSRRAFAFVFACVVSHPLLDMLTNGGPGVMLGWPLSSARWFAPWRPIEVSPLGTGFFSERGVVVVLSELVWLLLPALVLALLARHRKT